ncbi:MAG: hypothetical protein K940chlam5_00262 [Candidatus Anoxychlamydiales bacterium]|nr:hypothetical protein [Candidatus Anoxychlamydiales bacterium]
MSSTGPVGLSNEVFERAFKNELENNRDPEVVLDIYNMGSGSLKVSLIKLCNSDRETLLHLLANQILANQEDEEDTSSLIESAFEILSTEDLKKDLKELVTCQDADSFSFLDSAIFCRNEKLNFVYQILKLVPKEDRAACKRDIDLEEFEDELESQDVGSLLGFFHLSNDKTSLAKKRDPKNVTLLHVLGMQLIQKQLEKQDTSYLMDITLKILKTKTLKVDLKNLVTAIDEEGKCFLDYAVLCRNEKLNFMDEVLKLIPIEDRDECLRFIFQRVLKNEDLDAALDLFYKSKDSEKVSLATISGLRNMTFLQMLVMQVFKDLTKKGSSELLEQPIKVLKQIDPKERKNVANLQNSMGRSVFHLAALCKYKNFNLLYELLKIIPPKDRTTCLETQDSLQLWSPLHSKANATTHENDLNERSIKEILDLLPIGKAKEALTTLKDKLGHSYQEIQEKKKEDEAFFKKEGDREQHLETRRRAGLAAVISDHQKAARRPSSFRFLSARKRSQSTPNLLPIDHRNITVADFGIPPRAAIEEKAIEPPKEPKEEPERPKTPPSTPNLFDALQRSIYDDLK